MNKGPAYFKALKVIDSCITDDHFNATRSYLDNYFNVFVKNSTNYFEHRSALELFDALVEKFHEKLNKK